MTYRDETLILREKLAELDAEIAKLDGRRLGLSLAVAEMREREDTAKKQLRTLPVALRARRLGASALGGLGVLVLIGGGCIGVAVGCQWLFGGVDLELDGTVRASGGAAAEGTACEVVVDEDGGDDTAEGSEPKPCRAHVTCDGRRIYAGRGGCGTFFDESHVEYWDHAPASDDGSPILVISEHEQRAVIRDGTRITRIELR